MKALAIKQPWAEAVARGWKDIENRDWRTSYRGPVLIHASKLFDDDEAHAYLDVIKAAGIRTEDRKPPLTIGDARRRCGGIIGIAEIVDCVSMSRSPWFFGRYGFVMANARAVDLVPCRGMPGLFDVPDEVVRQLPGAIQDEYPA